jgi:hypothetical protein
MSTRYIFDAEGKPIEAVLDLEEIRKVLEAQRQVAEVVARVEKATREFVNTQAHTRTAAKAAEDGTQYRRDLRTIADAQRTLSSFVWDLEELEEIEEDLEDLEAIQAYDADMEKLERGDGELVSWEQAKREIDEERAELRSRGEL